MRKALFILGLGLVMQHTVFAQRKCGIVAEQAAMIAKDPSWVQRFADQKASLQGNADNYKLLVSSGAAERTTATISPIPVIFHIIVDSAQFIQMGGSAGIIKRVDSQIVVLNRDYNRQNPDSTLIPSGWKPLYASTGIHFGLAHTAPDGSATPGYEIKITDYSFTAGLTQDYPDAKDATNGLASWDVTKYLNVWCIYFSDNTGLLGITCPKSYTVGFGAESAASEGICMNFLALGSQTKPSTLTFPSGGDYAGGRTLTHEIGHFFEIWHTWGDDGGACPWAAGGSDDGLADTPPESDAHYGNPTDTVAGGSGTINDGCQFNSGTNEQPIGISTLDYMNYTDDDAMHLFTKDQAAAMDAMALVPPSSGHGLTGFGGTTGESYTLTQNPSLLNYPAGTGVIPVKAGSSFNVFPNPATGIVNITFDQATDQLLQINVTDMVGQVVQNINTTGQQKNYYSIDLSTMSKGIYFVRCNFASGSITRKIVLQ